MPRVKRRAKLRSRRGNYGVYHREELRSGHWWPCFDLQQCFCGDEELQQEGWEDLQGELLPKWIEEHPGTRPFAWWRFDAPEPRDADNGLIENEAQYLQRHGLLTPEEQDHPDVKEALARGNSI